MKEDNWKQFVTESLNLDPWDPVYKVCRSKTALLNRCQRMVLYAYLNVCRTVSTESMHILMGASPWDLECERRGVMCMLKNG